MARTALQLLTELGLRRRELILSTPSGSGTRTTLVDNELAQRMPTDLQQTYVWVFGRQDTVAANRGQQARGSSWDIDTTTLSLISPGMPAAVDTTGTYEIHLRSERARKLEAINAGIGQLDLSWSRRFYDASIVTVSNQWAYTLPASANFAKVIAVDIQATQDTSQVGFPYRSADFMNWRAYPVTTLGGVQTWTLQFEHMPPPGYILRVWGEGYYTDLAADSDILAISGNWERKAIEWIFDYAKFFLIDEDLQSQPSGWMEKGRAMMMDALGRSREKLLLSAPAHESSRIITPKTGQGLLHNHTQHDLSEFGIFGWGN